MKTEWANLFGEEGPVFVSGVVASVHPDLSEDTLDELVKNFDASRHEPPVCVGHPKDNSPAYGWVSGIWKKGKDLYADMALLPEFVELIKKKVFRKRSIAFYTDFEGTGKKVLRHIGFLGGMPPRIKGMPDLVFAESSDYSEIEEAINQLSWKIVDLATYLRSHKNQLIESQGGDSADKIIPEWLIKSLETRINVPCNPDDTPIYKDPQEGNTVNYNQEQYDAALLLQKTNLENQFSESKKALEGKMTALEAENTDLKSSVKSFADKAAKAEVEAFCDTQIKEARMAPAEKDGFVELFMEMGAEARTKFKANVEKRPKVLTFGEQSQGNRDQQPGSGAKVTETDKAFNLDEKDIQKFGDTEEFRMVK